MLKKTLKISLALMLLSSLILAQNKLYIEGKAEITEQKTEAYLILSNVDTVLGVQATLTLDKPSIAVDTIVAETSNSIFRYYSPDSFKTNIVMLINRGSELKPGKHRLAKIIFKTLNHATSDTVRVGIENLLVIDPSVRKLNAIGEGIMFVLKKANPFEVKFKISYSSIVVSFKNNEKVTNLNFELKVKQSSSVDFVSPMPRIAGFMNLSYEVKDNVLKVNLTSTSFNGLEPGEGEIFFITGRFNSTDDIEVTKIEATSSNGVIVTPNYKLISSDVYPADFKLFPNYPNPFNPATTIKFTLPFETRVQIAIFDLSGRMVKVLIDRVMPAGEHFVTWDGTDESGNKVSSGVYIYRMYSDKFVDVKKMILAK